MMGTTYILNKLSSKSNSKHINSASSKNPKLLYSWGNGIYGQLGLGAEKISQPIPELVETLSDQKIEKIFAGYDSSAALLENSNIFVWGKCRDGTIGNFPGVSNNVVLPTDFPYNQLSSKPVSISLSKEHSALADSKGQVFTWGKDSFGSLGHSNKEIVRERGLVVTKIVFGQANIPATIKQVACGFNFTVNNKT